MMLLIILLNIGLSFSNLSSSPCVSKATAQEMSGCEFDTSANIVLDDLKSDSGVSLGIFLIFEM